MDNIQCHVLKRILFDVYDCLLFSLATCWSHVWWYSLLLDKTFKFCQKNLRNSKVKLRNQEAKTNDTVWPMKQLCLDQCPQPKLCYHQMANTNSIDLKAMNRSGWRPLHLKSIFSRSPSPVLEFNMSGSAVLSRRLVSTWPVRGECNPNWAFKHR